MTRNLGTANAVQSQAATVFPVVFVELNFVGGMVRAHSGIGSITWGGNTFSGVGDFAGIGDVEEGTDIAARGLTLSISGIPSSVLSEALEAKYRGRSVKVWLGFANSSGVLVADPYQMFGGRMDTMSVEDAGDTCGISVQCENRLIDLRRSRVSRWTNEEQVSRYAGDTGLRFIARLADKTLKWGVPNTVTAPQTSSPAAKINAVFARIL